MSEIVSYFQVRDVDPIRIACHYPDCRVVLELHPLQVEEAMKKSNCCCCQCGRPFTKTDVEGGADVITSFAKAVLALNGLAPQVGIELPMRQGV